jgi:hypothetical protein
MYKIHKPHVDSEYIGDIRYAKTLDADGSPDWEIHYIPGRRAKAHFAFFRRNIFETSATIDVAVSEAAPVVRSKQIKAKRVGKRSSAAVAALQDRGVSPAIARELAEGREDDPTLIDSLEWGDHLIRQARPGTFRNPAGFYIYLVREEIKPPRDFETSRQRAARHAEQAEEQERRFERFQLERAYEKYVENEAAKYVNDKIDRTEFANLQSQKKNVLRSQFRNMTPDQLDDLAHQAVLTEIRRAAPIKDFNEFCRGWSGVVPDLQS